MLLWWRVGGPVEVLLLLLWAWLLLWRAVLPDPDCSARVSRWPPVCATTEGPARFPQAARAGAWSFARTRALLSLVGRPPSDVSGAPSTTFRVSFWNLEGFWSQAALVTLSSRIQPKIIFPSPPKHHHHSPNNTHKKRLKGRRTSPRYSEKGTSASHAAAHVSPRELLECVSWPPSGIGSF